MILSLPHPCGGHLDNSPMQEGLFFYQDLWIFECELLDLGPTLTSQIGLALDYD